MYFFFSLKRLRFLWDTRNSKSLFSCLHLYPFICFYSVQVLSFEVFFDKVTIPNGRFTLLSFSLIRFTIPTSGFSLLRSQSRDSRPFFALRLNIQKTVFLLSRHQQHLFLTFTLKSHSKQGTGHFKGKKRELRETYLRKRKSQITKF